ncbi:aldehyde dehydrogenase, putative [Entamoeba dispar SAW760]|uniref:Aldehyde dehydrogenase n=1 Tax=Entamoeba dispar (strain ATCC PRA-260 / SAW760) TaxID=370354 RepID=B0EHN5_ENTDS|nr:aldehyde dehydrogenase, putative [Entamoeba dispar SAW760]EDR25969.1 aldehyde dehydrogenase, putative [Entamoeba dispar SAW760]|eukprot:EDR25969.1 aldehyde dehydrogenase, putative [Entamoeba dispar SAW760]
MDVYVLSLSDVLLNILLIGVSILGVLFLIFQGLKYIIGDSMEKKLFDKRLEQIKNQQPLEPTKYQDIQIICKTLKESYSTNALRPLDARMEVLYCLYRMVVDNKQALSNAIREDLHRDVGMCVAEVNSVIHEINFLRKNLKKYLRRKQVPTVCAQLFGKSFVAREPYGCVCIISPWNFPANLSLIPCAGAIACGNTVFLKMSKYSMATSKLIAELCDKYIPSEYLRCEYLTGREAIQECCSAPFDYYFFTGSTYVGKLVNQAAAEKMVPATLELGGKNPAIVDKNVNLKVAAKRIAWAKSINAGQICVCVDHVFVPRSIKKEFCEAVKNSFIKFFGEDQKKSEDFGRIITKSAAKKMKEIIDQSDVYYGGEVDIENKYVQPTILQNVKIDDLCMKEEIFGPILPVIEYDTLDEVFEMVKQHPNPLACYVFTEDNNMFERVIAKINSGAIYNNDSIVHLLNPNLPFGGNCQSGIGCYHGKYTFDTFSRPRAVCNGHTRLDLSLKDWPFTSFQSWAVDRMAASEIPVVSYL